MRTMAVMWRNLLLVILAGSLSLSGLTACTRGEVELKNTVSAYTQMLAEALAKPDAEKMKFFASSSEIIRIDSYILLMLKDKKVLKSTLQQLDFHGVTIDKKKMVATVTTHEEWTFYYVDEKSRQPISKEERIAYNNVYHLISEQGHWVVDKVDMNETQAAAPASPAKPGEGDLPGAKQNVPPAGKF